MAMPVTYATVNRTMLLGLSLVRISAGLPPRQSIPSSAHDLRVLSKEIDGFPRVTIVRLVHGRDRVLYQDRKEGLFLRYVLPWTIKSPRKPIHCFLIAYEYGSGSSNLLTIVGPDGLGKWKELLHANANAATRFPPQFADLVGDGILDVLVLNDPDGGRGHTGIENVAHAKVDVWRWSPKRGRYFLKAKTEYRHRFNVKGDRSSPK